MLSPLKCYCFMREFLAPILAVVIALHATNAIAADEKPATSKSRQESLVEERGELMRKLAESFDVQSSEKGFPQKLETRPIFRYSDPARDCISASLWKLGGEGRPKALLAMELHLSTPDGSAALYEYSSLTESPFIMTSTDMRWSPKSTLYEFKPLPEMRAPEKSAPRRLIQMREAANRFASSEVDKDQRCELRLLPQPIDRYKPVSAENADGAIFLFVFGTNPEVVLFIESDGTQWTYAVGRMTGAEVVAATLDGRVAWEGPPVIPGPSSPYTGSATPVLIPGFTADGKEIAE